MQAEDLYGYQAAVELSVVFLPLILRARRDRLHNSHSAKSKRKNLVVVWEVAVLHSVEWVTTWWVQARRHKKFRSGTYNKPLKHIKTQVVLSEEVCRTVFKLKKMAQPFSVEIFRGLAVRIYCLVLLAAPRDPVFP